jgi:hypothetical protein
MAGRDAQCDAASGKSRETCPIRIYVCYEPDLRICAERLDVGSWTNADFDAYDRRFDDPCDSPLAESFRPLLRAWMESAQVVICLISATTADEPWIAWELRTAKALTPRRGLIGVLLKDYVEPPAELKGCGAMFVPFRKDAVEQAVAWAAALRESSTEDFTLLED